MIELNLTQIDCIALVSYTFITFNVTNLKGGTTMRNILAFLITLALLPFAANANEATKEEHHKKAAEHHEKAAEHDHKAAEHAEKAAK